MNDIDALRRRLYGLRSPHLRISRPRVHKNFDVAICGRTIEVSHRGTGHRDRYLWFRDPPHLRGTDVQASEMAHPQPGAFRADADKAALLELRDASLVN